jgi:hypothetical protein
MVSRIRRQMWADKNTYLKIDGIWAELWSREPEPQVIWITQELIDVGFDTIPVVGQDDYVEYTGPLDPDDKEEDG